jgi:Spy/CpxP family protein refolding chaperone
MRLSTFSAIKSIVQVVAVAALVVTTASSALAQPGGGGRGGFGRGGFGMFGGGGGNELMLLLNDDIREELGLVDDQIEKLRAISDKQREEMRSMFQGAFGGGQGGGTEEERQKRFEEMRTKLQDRMAEIQKDVDGILLPHQSKRIKQIGRQMRLRGMTGSINNDVLAEELKLTEEQKEKLREKAVDVQKKLNEKLAKLRKEAEDDLLSVLSVEQRVEYKELVGEPFDTQRMMTRSFGGPGGPGGGPGAPGGPPGGGRVGRGNQNNN